MRFETNLMTFCKQLNPCFLGNALQAFLTIKEKLNLCGFNGNPGFNGICFKFFGIPHLFLTTS